MRRRGCGRSQRCRPFRAVWIQQYYRDRQGLRWRGKGEQPPAALAIDSPSDTDARYGIKRGVGWRGYKAHCTKTCEPDRPHLIVHVATTVATTADVDTMPARHADLAGVALLPDEHLVDASYVSVDGVLAARADHGVELVGPLPPDCGRQARDEGGFDLTRFRIDWDHKQVTCPNGKTARNWRQGTSRHGLPSIQATFRTSDCTPCPDSTTPSTTSEPSKPPRPGGTATPTAPGSRAPSRRPAAAATSTTPATAACPRPTCSTC